MLGWDTEKKKKQLMYIEKLRKTRKKRAHRLRIAFTKLDFV